MKPYFLYLFVLIVIFLSIPFSYSQCVGNYTYSPHHDAEIKCEGGNNSAINDYYVTETGSITKTASGFFVDATFNFKFNYPFHSMSFSLNPLYFFYCNYGDFNGQNQYSMIHVPDLSDVVCHAKAILDYNPLSKYKNIFNDVFQSVYVVPNLKFSLSKTYSNNVYPNGSSVANFREVEGYILNPSNLSVLLSYQFVKQTMIDSQLLNQSDMNPIFDLENLILLPSQKVSSLVWTSYSNSDIFWLLINSSYFLIPHISSSVKYSVVTTPPSQDIGVSMPSFGSGGNVNVSGNYNYSTVNGSSNISNSTNSSSLSVKRYSKCVPFFNRVVSLTNYSVNVELIFFNPCPTNKSVFVTETVPQNASLISYFGKLNNFVLSTNFVLSPLQKKILRYSFLRNKTTVAYVFSPTRVSVDNQSFLMKPVIIPQNKSQNILLVVKKISFDGPYALVEIDVTNTGINSTFYLKEYETGFSEITKSFYSKGLWVVNLDNHQTWTVHFKTMDFKNLYSIPQVVGYNGKVMYKLFSSSRINEEYSSPRNNLESFGSKFIIVSGLFSLALFIWALLSKYDFVR